MQPIVQLYREARRRKVFRTAALYVLGSWAVLQVADVLFPGFGIPETAIKALVWAAVLGFPVALTFGWLFEVGPGGVRRTQPRAAAETAEPVPLGRRDYLLLAAFVVIGAILVFRAVQEVRETPVATEPDVASTEGEDDSRLPNSIAVLPFTNISSDPGNEYFCDGISEEILNEISAVRNVNVIGRTSSFAFKGSNVGIEKISATLGVHYVLQGSVRKSDARLRISAQLLDERGRQLWTQTFDRELADVFEIQQDIARTVAAQVARQVESRPEATPRPSLEAYDRYLAGRELLHRRDVDGALTELRHAIDLDPGFAEAQAEWAIARLIGSPSKQEMDSAAAAIDRALELKPQLLRAQAARGLWLLQSTPSDDVAAESELRGVLEQDPNMSDALLWLSSALSQLDKPEESREILQRAFRIDPLHPAIAANLSTLLLESGDDEAGLQLLQRQLQQPNPSSLIYLQLLDVYRLRGRLVELNAVAKDFALHNAPQHLTLALSYALLGKLPAAEHWIERSLEDFPDWWLNPYFGAVVPAWRGDPEVARQQIERAMQARGSRIDDLNRNVRIWYGGFLARSGRYAGAIEVLGPLAVMAVTPLSLYLDYAPESDGWHALAWSYRHSGQEAGATRILSALRDACRSQVDDRQHPAQSNLLFYCAENALMDGDAEQALVLLERAVERGWREYYLRRNDPYWAALENDPRYRALMDRVKADVERQRAEVERIDAAADFVATLDAAVAARRGSDKSAEINGQ